MGVYSEILRGSSLQASSQSNITSVLVFSEVYNAASHRRKPFSKHFQDVSELRSSRLYTQFF